jgi:hypothetical protein
MMCSIMCPACMGQAVPSLTSPRVYQSFRGAGARLEGLDKQFFGYLILQKFGFGTCLATAVESARIRQTGRNVARGPSHAHCTRHTSVCA